MENMGEIGKDCSQLSKTALVCAKSFPGPGPAISLKRYSNPETDGGETMKKTAE